MYIYIPAYFHTLGLCQNKVMNYMILVPTHVYEAISHNLHLNCGIFPKSM